MWIWWASKWLSKLHDVLAKSMNFRTVTPKAQYKHRFQWNLVCGKVGYQTFSIPNFSWFLKATPMECIWMCRAIKDRHLSITKLQLLVDFMSKFRRAYLFYAYKHVANLCSCFLVEFFLKKPPPEQKYSDTIQKMLETC